MADKYCIERWEISATDEIWRVYERVGRWPFREWVLRANALESETKALDWIKANLARPRLISKKWLRADGTEDLSW